LIYKFYFAFGIDLVQSFQKHWRFVHIQPDQTFTSQVSHSLHYTDSLCSTDKYKQNSIYDSTKCFCKYTIY